MKKLPEIMDQGSLGACLCYSISQYLLQEFVIVDPVKLYFDTKALNKDRDPRVEDVLNYLKEQKIIKGYDSQIQKKESRFIFIDKFNEWKQLRVLKNCVLYSTGAIISLRTNDDVKKTGYYTEEILKNGGDHSVYLYDYEEPYFRIINSWGKNWGDGTGCLYLHKDLIKYIQTVYTISV